MGCWTSLRILVVAAALAYPALGTALNMFLPTPKANFSVDVVSFKERKFQTILRQQYDFSCGSAAVASLMTYHYDDPRTEEQVFRDMWERGDQEKIKQQGFSLLDMKHYLQRNGYQADGFRFPLDRLAQLGVPAITLINNNGYMHFVVIKGLSDDDVLLGDPVLGVRVMSREAFGQIWNNGIIFLVRNKVQVARASFNNDDDWATVARAPLDHGRSMTIQSLADFNLLLPARSDF